MIRVSKSCLDLDEKQAVMRVLDKEFLGMGEEVQIFEQKLSDFFGRPTVCVVNGTAALHLALQACGITIGDEVIVPSITYVASFQAISATGATPVACDVKADSLCIDWKDAEKRITPKTKAIMPVHYAGGVGQIDKIYNLANKYNIRVVEDAAHAFGSIHKTKRVGGFGDVACFSFDGIKNITSGEGGCIVTADEKILNLVRDSRLLGVENDSLKRFKGTRSWNFQVSNQGWRYHMSNIMAAIGIEQLKKFNLKAKKRQNLAKYYDVLLADNKNITFLRKNYDEVVPHIYPVILNCAISRDKIIASMIEFKIQTGIHYQRNDRLSYYKYNK